MNENKICVIDFDGTFIRNDFFEELFFKKLITNPFFLINHFIIKKKGILDLKYTLLNNYYINYSIDFLLNNIVSTWINENRHKYEKIILVSATPDFFVKRILQSITCFDEIYGSVNINLKGENKVIFIIKNLNKNFDYIGNSKDDIPIFKKSILSLKITKKGLIYVKY
jgi:hypothetical protein